MKAIVAERGQMTIPKPLRLKLGIKPGTVLELYIKNTNLVVSKASQNNDAVDEVYGCLKLSASTDKMVKELRGKV